MSLLTLQSSPDLYGRDTTSDFLTSQLERSPDSFQKALLPNPSVEITGKRHLTDIYDWTSGFFPGAYGTPMR